MEPKYSFPILLAEDDPVSRRLLEKTLHKSGYQVTAVENGKIALDLFKKNFFPIVLTDWVMPEIDGLELCKAIRNVNSKGYVFIVLLTSKDSKDDILVGFEAGADDYLIKPPHYAELNARLKTGMRILELERSLKRANEEIRILSNIDSLTGIYNRGYLHDHLTMEIKKARRYGHPLSLALCDIDHFKKVNDNHGHQIGDIVLKEFAQCIKESIRNSVDWAVRYGGEEFLIVLPETDLKNALSLAERIRNAVFRKVLKIRGSEISITASFGVVGFHAGIPDKLIAIDALINQADMHLYRAKQEGRNLVRGDELKECGL